MRPIIAVLTAIALLATAAVADARPLARDCDGVIYSRDGAPIGVTIHRGAVTCANAKRILRAYLNSTRPCEGNGCVREHSGWTCVGRERRPAPAGGDLHARRAA